MPKKLSSTKKFKSQNTKQDVDLDTLCVLCRKAHPQKTPKPKCETELELKKELRKVVESDPYRFEEEIEKSLEFNCDNASGSLMMFLQRGMLSVAAAKNPVLFQDMITKHKMDIEQINNFNEPVLHYVVRFYPTAIPLVLAHGANIEARNKRGEGALHVAIKKNHAAIELLLANNADIHAKTSDGGTIKSYLKEFGSKPLCDKMARMFEEE
ncbi:MAG: ankyrin repeat domain-containing protein [Promethearchaeota archaeon]